MFSKKKKKPQISLPSNFEHRVHTGFDKREGRYVGLPLQWASIVGNNQILKSTNRPLPLVDPSEITPTEILDLKTIVRPHLNNNKLQDDQQSNGIVLPKTSNVARSNSLRSSSPPRMRRDLRGNANVPPSLGKLLWRIFYCFTVEVLFFDENRKSIGFGVCVCTFWKIYFVPVHGLSIDFEFNQSVAINWIKVFLRVSIIIWFILL